jgi:hypothetical protein
MVCNNLITPLPLPLPLLPLRMKRFGARSSRDLTGLLLGIRRTATLAILLLGCVCFRLAGEACALVSIGLISFAEVAQFVPAILGGMHWRGGNRAVALAGLLLAGLLLGFGVWSHTLMPPTLAKSGWLDSSFLRDGLSGLALLKPEAFLGLTGFDALTNLLFWRLLVKPGGLCRCVALALALGGGNQPGLVVGRCLQAHRPDAPGVLAWQGPGGRRCCRWLGASSVCRPRSACSTIARSAWV